MVINYETLHLLTFKMFYQYRPEALYSLLLDTAEWKILWIFFSCGWHLGVFPFVSHSVNLLLGISRNKAKTASPYSIDSSKLIRFLPARGLWEISCWRRSHETSVWSQEELINPLKDCLKHANMWKDSPIYVLRSIKFLCFSKEMKKIVMEMVKILKIRIKILPGQVMLWLPEKNSLL